MDKKVETQIKTLDDIIEKSLSFEDMSKLKLTGPTNDKLVLLTTARALLTGLAAIATQLENIARQLNKFNE